MHVLVTSAHGFVGSRISSRLLAQGHTVSGLVRSDAAAAKLDALGIRVVRATLEQPDLIAAAARDADAVIHTAFDHDFSQYMANIAKDFAVVSAILDALAGSDKPFVYTSAMLPVVQGRPVAEADSAESSFNPRAKTEVFTIQAAARGIRAMVVRLPPTVHGPNDHGFLPGLIGMARKNGKAVFAHDADASWSAVHVEDAGQLFVDVLHKGSAGKSYHAVQDEVIPFEQVARAIGEGLGVPAEGVKTDEMEAHVGFFAPFTTKNMSASSKVTREEVGWEPKEVGLLQDLKQGDYFAGATKGGEHFDKA